MRNLTKEILSKSRMVLDEDHKVVLEFLALNPLQAHMITHDQLKSLLRVHRVHLFPRPNLTFAHLKWAISGHLRPFKTKKCFTKSPE